VQVASACTWKSPPVLGGPCSLTMVVLPYWQVDTLKFAIRVSQSMAEPVSLTL
jgi:hypothetical protein